MADSPNPAFEKEMALRGQIIEALVNANAQLRHRVAVLAAAIAQNRTAFATSEIDMLEKLIGMGITEKGNDHLGVRMATSENNNDHPDVRMAVIENDNGLRNISSAITESVSGLQNVSSALTESDNNLQNINPALTEKDNPHPDVNPAFTESVNAHQNISSALTEKDNAHLNVSPALPEKINEQNLPMHIVRQKVKSMTGYSGPKSGLYSMASLIVHLYNGGAGGYADLCKATYLSESGLGKLMTKMRKRCLIRSGGYRQPVLTSQALRILKEAWAASEMEKGKSNPGT